MVLPNILLKKLMIEIKASDLISIEIPTKISRTDFESSKPPLHDAPAPDSSALSLASPRFGIRPIPIPHYIYSSFPRPSSLSN